MIYNFIKDSSWVLVTNLGTKLFSFLMLSFLARFLLSPEDFAFYFLIVSVAASINQISDLGLAITLQQTTANLVGNKAMLEIGRMFSTSFIIIILCHIAISLLILLFPDEAHHLLLNSKGNLHYFLLILPLAVLTVSSEFPLRLIMGLGDFKGYSVRNLLISLITMLSVVGCAFLFGLFGTIIGQVMALMIGSVYALYMLRMVGPNFGFSYIQSFGSFLSNSKSLISKGFVMYLGNTLYPALANIYTISLITLYLPEEQFAYIRIAAAMTAFFTIIPFALQPVTLSFIAGKPEDDKDGILLQYLQLRYLVAFSFLSGLALIACLPFVLPVFFGAHYLSGLDFICLLILMNAGIILPNGLVVNFLMAKGRGAYVGRISMMSITISSSFLYMFMPEYPVSGYILGNFAGYLFGFILVLLPIISKFPVRQKKITISFFIFTIFLMVVLGVFYGQVQILSFKSIIVFSIIIVYIILFIYCFAEKNEVNKFLNLIKIK